MEHINFAPRITCNFITSSDFQNRCTQPTTATATPTKTHKFHSRVWTCGALPISIHLNYLPKYEHFIQFSEARFEERKKKPIFPFQMLLLPKYSCGMYGEPHQICIKPNKVELRKRMWKWLLPALLGTGELMYLLQHSCVAELNNYTDLVCNRRLGV